MRTVEDSRRPRPRAAATRCPTRRPRPTGSCDRLRRLRVSGARGPRILPLDAGPGRFGGPGDCGSGLCRASAPRAGVRLPVNWFERLKAGVLTRIKREIPEAIWSKCKDLRRDGLSARPRAQQLDLPPLRQPLSHRPREVHPHPERPGFLHRDRRRAVHRRSPQVPRSPPLLRPDPRGPPLQRHQRGRAHRPVHHRRPPRGPRRHGYALHHGQPGRRHGREDQPAHRQGPGRRPAPWCWSASRAEPGCRRARSR